MSNKPTGLGVDATGGPVIDPTANVISLVQANKESADALRDMHDRYITAEINTVRETVKWLEKVSDIHQRHDREIHKMEQEKLAAFRESDEVARITEANRNLAALEVVERRTAADSVESNKRIAALEKSSYEGAGKGTGRESQVRLIALGVGLLVSLFMAALTVGGIVVAIAYAIKG